VDSQGAFSLGDAVTSLASYEGFSAHALAMERRGPDRDQSPPSSP
jgi:hypothetical protein